MIHLNSSAMQAPPSNGAKKGGEAPVEGSPDVSELSIDAHTGAMDKLMLKIDELKKSNPLAMSIWGISHDTLLQLADTLPNREVPNLRSFLDIVLLLDELPERHLRDDFILFATGNGTMSLRLSDICLLFNELVPEERLRVDFFRLVAGKPMSLRPLVECIGRCGKDESVIYSVLRTIAVSSQQL